MAVFDCATRQARSHTAEELVAIEAARAAEAARPPVEPINFNFTPKEFLEAFLTAMVQENVITAAKATAIAIRTRDALKR